MASKFDTKVMRGLIHKATAYLGSTSPNPTVGAACYKEGVCIGEAFHEKAGAHHAERSLLLSLGDKAKGSTLYVTLEPCSHTGKTPPCSDLVLTSGIKRLVIGCPDPNPKNKPMAEAYDRQGIKVETGVCLQAAQRLIVGFMSHIIRQRPYVRLKVGTSLDGLMAAASGESLYFTCEASRRQVHLQRRASDAILVGAGTVLTDDPSLTVRFGYLTSTYTAPVKLILDPHAQLNPGYTVFEDGQAVLFSEKAYSCSFPASVRVVQLPPGTHQVHWAFILKWCYKNDIQTMYIEGGQSVFQSALTAGVVDEWIQYVAPKPLNDPNGLRPVAPGVPALGLKELSVEKVGVDTRLRGFVTPLDWLV